MSVTQGSSAHYDRMLSSSFIFHIHGGGYIADMESLDKPALVNDHCSFAVKSGPHSVRATMI
jgi:hypothetical protein